MSSKLKNNYHIFFGKHVSLAILQSSSREIYDIIVTADKFEEYKKLIDKKFWYLIKKSSDLELNRLCKMEDKHQGIAIKASDYIHKYSIDKLVNELKEKEDCCIFILDEVSDPNNFGAIIRNAYGFKVDAIIISNRNACPVTNAVVRSSVGYSEYMKIVEVPNLQNAILKLKDVGAWVFALDSHSSESDISSIFKKYNKSIFILGSEGFGIRDSLKKLSDVNIKIKTNPDIESLNVSSTSAIIAYEYFNARYS